MSREEFNTEMDVIVEETRGSVPSAPEVFVSNVGLPAARPAQVVEKEVVVYQDNPNALMRGEDGNLHFANYTLTRTGIEISGDIESETWRNLGDVIFGLGDTLPVWLGDYLVQTEDKWKVDYIEIAEVFGRDKATLYNYCWVMRAVPPTLRAESLNFNHYKLVAALDTLADRERWLRDALSNGWSARQLEKEMMKKRGKSNPFKAIDQSAAVIKRAYSNPAGLKGDKLTKVRQAASRLRAWLDEFESQLPNE